MEKNDLILRKSREKNRLNRLLKTAGCEEWKIKTLRPVIENTAWMCVKLEDAVEEIAEEPIVIPYDNGGDQKGIRQNPYFQGYEALWKAYMAGMGQIMSAADTKKDSKVTKLKPNSVIAMVRSGQKQA